MSSTNPTGLSPMTAKLLETGKWSDLTIKCHEKEWKVHRSVVCLQSKPLAAAVDHSFKESITGEIDLEGDERDIVERFLKFLYSTDYCDNPKVATAIGANQTIPGQSQALITNTKVYILAEKYDVPALKELAAKKYSLALPLEGNTSSYFASLKLIYMGTPDSDKLLRDVAARYAAENYKILIKNKQFESLCQEHGQIGFDTMKAAAEIVPVYPHDLPPKTCPSRTCRFGDAYTRTLTKTEKSQSKFLRSNYLCEHCSSAFS